ncbi:AAA family ATPase [Desulfovibrio legallii]|uniref:AAA domain-containing protein n=1 Tax=Desulfovibrio legallii TaxID=571438 RepID=A0A1G7KN06_9BACT|nr:AAA family ATPase [Desulfovibrio legallii]SDF38424.1 AAA domain-containing protein [Desulfovibrio legallii]
MYIQSFHMDGFGIFADAGVEKLSPGLTVFLGQNEAGKSTCLEFLRTALTGYPAPHSNEGKAIPGPLRGGRAGGSLTLNAGKDGLLRLTRRPGANGLTLLDEAGHALDPAVLQRLLAGVDREVYRNVFGFSLTELENLKSLTAEGVRNALYGASFGPGLRSPAEALKALENQTTAIFKPGGSVPLLNKALREFTDLHKKIAELEQESAGYDALAAELAACREDLRQTRHRRTALEAERRLLERRLHVWLQWNEWRMAGVQLERLEPEGAAFPEDGRARLARAQEAGESCRRNLAAEEEKLRLLRERRNAVTLDPPLLEALPALRRLTERKSGFRRAEGALTAQEAACRRTEENLQRELARLGPGWTCQRIRATDRSLFAREGLEKQAKEMDTAISAHQAAVGTLHQCNQEAAAAEREAAAAAQTLEALPTPAALVDDQTRDDLRQALARHEEASRQRPARLAAVQEARTTFSRAYAPLRLGGAAGSEKNDQEAGRILDDLLTRQDEALDLAAQVQAQLAQAEEALQAVRRSEGEAADAKNRMERLREEQRVLNGPARDVLNNQATALRQLRALAANLSTEQDRLADLEGRLTSEAPGSRIKSLPMLVLGALLFLAGAAMFFAAWRLGVTALPLTQELVVPVKLEFSYLLLCCGVVFLTVGAPHDGPERRRRKNEFAHLQSRRNACAVHVAELEEQARQLCAAADVPHMDLITLEATEVRLERERELCFREERARKDMETLRQSLDQIRAELARRQTAHAAAEAQVQQVRRRWHECLLALHVGNVPAPEGAAAFFARVEAARLALGGAAAAQAELESLDADLRAQEARMRAVPAVAELLPEQADAAALTRAVRQVLDSCREADAAREQRIKAEAALHNAQSECRRAADRQARAAAAQQQAEERLAAAQGIWSASLEGLGLDASLNPETVRQAFASMETCLAAAAELERAQAALAQSRTELAALREPLASLLTDLHREPERDADGTPRWLESLDAALAAAESAAEAQAQHDELERRAAEQADAAAAATAALEAADLTQQSLLALAGARDAEHFLHLAALHDEREQLRQRRQYLEDALRLAAEGAPLEAFLAGFADADQETQERRCAAIDEELPTLQEREDALAAKANQLAGRVEALSCADELARLRQQEASVKESMERLAARWSRAALARSLLASAKRTFEEERQPEVIRLASQIFSRVTDRRWRGISASLEDASLRILPAEGEAVGPEALSRGAREQAYLALRLAYIKNHAAHAAPLPVIMDEVLVNFDPRRAERMARAFVDLTGGTPEAAHQLLYFTCQPHTVDLLRKTDPGAAVLLVEDGRIRAA